MVVQTCRAFFSSLSSQVNIKLIDYYIRYFKTTEVASPKSSRTKRIEFLHDGEESAKGDKCTITPDDDFDQLLVVGRSRLVIS